MHTKTATDTALELKANSSDVATPSALKAHAADVYTKTQTDPTCAPKANPTFTGGLAINSANNEAKLVFGASGSSTIYRFECRWCRLDNSDDL